MGHSNNKLMKVPSLTRKLTVSNISVNENDEKNSEIKYIETCFWCFRHLAIFCFFCLNVDFC